MKTIDIYWQDLNEDAQKWLFETLGRKNVYYDDDYPLCTIEIEDEGD